MDRMTPPEEHYRYREQIGAFLLGKLDAVERMALQRHLNSCPVCQAEERELEPVVAALSYAAPNRIDEALWPPEHLEESTLAPILGEMRRARRYGWRFGWSAVAAAAICVVVMGLAGFTWFLEPAVSLELRKDAVRLEISTRGGELVFSAKLPDDSRGADPEKPEEPNNPAPAGGQKGESKTVDSWSGIPPVEGTAPESGDTGSPPGGEKPGATSPGTPSPETASPERSSPETTPPETTPPVTTSPGTASPGTASPGAAPEESVPRRPYGQSPACDQYSCAQQ